jgi:hypothetical protein
MNLFLDSNIWLSFYFYSREEIEAFWKLADLMEEGWVTLFLPQQVRDEVRRNRDRVVANALEPLTAVETTLEIPRLGEEHEEAEALRRALLEYRQARARLLDRILEDYGRRDLPADRFIDRLFGAARPVPVTDDVLARARARYDLGNPPGKEGSYGDAVNWECLLAAVPDGEDLFFITRDSDFYSRTSRDDFSPFLDAEWAERKRSRILFFNRLSAFCCDQLPHFRFATDVEKDLLVSELVESPSFVVTRRTLSRLARVPKLSDAQVEAVVDAALANPQIHWIARYPEVGGPLLRLVEGREEAVEPRKLERFRRLLAGEEWQA